MTATIEYAADLFVSAAILLTSYPAKSWFLWSLGLFCFTITIITKNLATWKASKTPE